eukprot:15449513-Alexandrium_andersonii.AAC.1
MAPPYRQRPGWRRCPALFLGQRFANSQSQISWPTSRARAQSLRARLRLHPGQVTFPRFAVRGSKPGSGAGLPGARQRIE